MGWGVARTAKLKAKVRQLTKQSLILVTQILLVVEVTNCKISLASCQALIIAERTSSLGPKLPKMPRQLVRTCAGIYKDKLDRRERVKRRALRVKNDRPMSVLSWVSLDTLMNTRWGPCLVTSIMSQSL